MEKMLFFNITAIFTTLFVMSLAATVSASGMPGTSTAPVAQQRTAHLTLVRTEKRRYQGRVTYQTAGDKETAPLNPPIVPRVYMVTPTRPAVK